MARVTGLAPSSVRAGAMKSALQAKSLHGAAEPELLLLADAGDQRLWSLLLSAVCVGETHFFRHREHFELVADRVRSAAKRPIRAWSAGCATGEEAYSLAAWLLQLLGEGQAEVLGTDLLESHVATARIGTYRRWSLRKEAPLLAPVVSAVAHEQSAPYHEASQFSVIPQVRAITSFATHNLLSPLPAEFGAFELVFCRNVFIYFQPWAVRAAMDQLLAALSPDGVLVLGPLDPVEGHVDLAQAKLLGPGVYQRRGTSSGRLSSVPARSAASEASDPTSGQQRVACHAPVTALTNSLAPGSAAVALHVQVLEFLEVGEFRSADAALARLTQVHADYVPGLFERALLHHRLGRV
ncbi:MAG TPA: CheR family methyltransferase, partial [Polyangiaceae bacterium]|nr:CheR family methyltransferase [Polyangiaceae bacterium]